MFITRPIEISVHREFKLSLNPKNGDIIVLVNISFTI